MSEGLGRTRRWRRLPSPRRARIALDLETTGADPRHDHIRLLRHNQFPGQHAILPGYQSHALKALPKSHRGAIEPSRVLVELRTAVDEPFQAQDLPYLVEIAHRQLELGDDIEAGQTQRK